MHPGSDCDMAECAGFDWKGRRPELRLESKLPSVGTTIFTVMSKLAADEGAINHVSLTRYPDLFARSFVVSSFGKTYHTTGWKVAYCVAPPPLTAEFRRVHQFVTFTTATPLQHGIADFLAQCPEHHIGLGAFYQAKRDLFCRLLDESRFRLTPSAGTFFQILDYSRITNEPDTELAKRWTVEKKVASIPVSVFDDDPPNQELLRFCFAKDDATLERAAEILCSA